ncbi:MAG: DUF1697 domain-containing protein [Cellulomonadaceae bacterium]|jgi:uncharacterized protein (DUF1697 family)|nr:DUF1697 domain-containing protein [Cellulomonadaceae bacterium]
MTAYVALLRAVNVGGTGKLPMADLRAMCESLGWGNVRTYIASGNVVFSSDDDAAQVRTALEEALARYAGKPVGVVVRTAAELAEALAGYPFTEVQRNLATIHFLPEPPPPNTVEETTGISHGELVALGTREVYLYFPQGAGTTRLKLPKHVATTGTARNLNTVAKLIAMCAEVG